MSIASFFKSLFGRSATQAPMQVAPISLHVTLNSLPGARGKKIKARMQEPKKQRRKRELQPWLNPISDGAVVNSRNFFKDNPALDTYTFAVQAPAGMPLERAQRLIASRFGTVLGNGRTSTTKLRARHTVIVSIRR